MATREADPPAGPTIDDDLDRLLPLPEERRSGIGLSLSGGGYRAALFHLGALRRLNELGVLAAVDAISSVSGGSILAAHLATTIGEEWPSAGAMVADWDGRVAVPFRRLCRKNIRTWPIANAMLPWNWLRDRAAIDGLIARYRADLTQLDLVDLPQRPEYTFCASDMTYGVNWTFRRDRIGSWQAGYTAPRRGEWSVAQAVGASSCFPPIFDPLPIDIDPARLRKGHDTGDGRDARIRGLRLSDGGLYDNLGLEPVWKSRRYVLVSDGGSTFDVQGDQGLLWRLNRYVQVMGTQAGKLRTRWLMASFRNADGDVGLRGTWWGIGSHVGRYPAHGPGYGRELVDDYISEVRTDLDSFSAREIAVLENHGYQLADAAIHSWVPELITRPGPPKPPHDEHDDPASVKNWLAGSANRHFPFGRLH